jgi:hypothetical protein
MCLKSTFQVVDSFMTSKMGQHEISIQLEWPKNNAIIQGIDYFLILVSIVCLMYSKAPFNLTIWKKYRQIKRGVKLIETLLQNFI